MRNATRLRVGGMLLFLGAASPAFTQVTMLNGDGSLNPPNPPVGATTVPTPDGPTVSPSDSTNSLIVTGPVDKSGAVPSINLDKLLSEQSGAPTTSKVDEYLNPPGGRSREVGGGVSGLLDQTLQK
jgi:hypothetical protein